MQDKLARAKHIRVAPDETQVAKEFADQAAGTPEKSQVSTEAQATEAPAASATAVPASTVTPTNQAPETPTPETPTSPVHIPLAADQGVKQTAAAGLSNAAVAQDAQLGHNAMLISICTIISRITGFARTWAMAFALGATALSSSYQVANNLPSMLYELVVGGMLVTAFLPVYMSVKKRQGNQAGNEYASNLLTLVVLILGVLALLCMVFAAQVIYTQSFYSDQSRMELSTFFFRFFAIQIVFYGCSAIVSGLLNANRDYLWSSIAPVANNLIVIVTFVGYALVAPVNQDAALYIIAIGNPLGVFVQMAIQLPALKRNGIRIRPHINIHDPAIKETLTIGIPAVVVMLCSFACVSVENAASYAFSDDGPSILAYARLWFTLPYSFLAVPITTTLFTELADMHADNNIDGMKRCITSGINQILFFMIPFGMYLMVFSVELVTLYHAGAFSMDGVWAVSSFLMAFAVGLPFYAINTYLQKICSSLRKMHVFAGFNLVAGAVQIGLTMFAASQPTVFPIEVIALAEGLFYLVGDVCVYAYLRKTLGSMRFRSTLRAAIIALVLGLFGAGVASYVLSAIEFYWGLNLGDIGQALLYICICGPLALVLTFGPAVALKVPEAQIISGLFGKLVRKFKRS